MTTWQRGYSCTVNKHDYSNTFKRGSGFLAACWHVRSLRLNSADWQVIRSSRLAEPTPKPESNCFCTIFVSCSTTRRNIASWKHITDMAQHQLVCMTSLSLHKLNKKDIYKHIKFSGYSQHAGTRLLQSAHYHNTVNHNNEAMSNSLISIRLPSSSWQGRPKP